MSVTSIILQFCDSQLAIGILVALATGDKREGRSWKGNSS